jgi:gliding motility-associated-like protein
MNKKITNKLFLLFFIAFSSNLFSQNLLTNGDFESGGSGTGFTTEYNLHTGSSDTQPGEYAISNNLSPLNSNFIASIKDNTTGAGNMMVIDGNYNTNATFWSAGDNNSGLCGLVPTKSYQFSYWVRSISSTTLDNATQPNIDVSFTGATGTIIYGKPIVDLPSVGWKQVAYTFTVTSTNGCVTINMKDTNGNGAGNDFAIDDLTVTEQPCAIPVILSVKSPDPVCAPSTVNIKDPAVTAGSIGGGTITYWIDDKATIPLVSPPPSAINITGKYYIKSTSGGCSDIKVVNVTVKPIVTPVFDQVPAICSGETLTPLPTISKNGVVGTWEPALLDNTKTTEYTFKPNNNVIPSLITNGDFSNGNTGFTTDYTFIPTSLGTSRGLYGINSNPEIWAPTFMKPCDDHSPGIGNMMIVDGSTVNTNNVGTTKLWCQTVPVVAGEDYIFDYYTTSLTSGDPARFEVEINSVSIGKNSLTYNLCNWVESSFSWNSGTKTTAEICIYDRNASEGGNDFGIDDISFKSTSIQCAKETKMTITVNPGSAIPTFDPVTAICSGGTLAPLPTTSKEGIKGKWLPALDNTTVTTTKYTFTPDAGQCATTNTMDITVNAGDKLPTFDPVTAICSGGTLAPLPTTSKEGIKGKWLPALDNTTVTTTKYTFTPDAGQCATTNTMDITVNAGDKLPTFDPVTAICSGGTLAPLPTTSKEGIKGKWLPALDNTTVTTTKYTFTPDAGQCAIPNTLDITVNPGTTPTFAAVNPICSGATLAPLPTTSLESITGTWLPALDNTKTTTYTFTPNRNQCATKTTKEIVVNPSVTPTFTKVSAICSGDVLNALPLSSIEGIAGTWLPALNNAKTTTYTFTPSSGICATTTTMEIVVNPIVSPTFDPVLDICSGETLAALPTASKEGIKGTWLPALDNTKTTTYEFTPNVGQCTVATLTVLTIKVNPTVTPTFNPIKDICLGETLAPLPVTSIELITGTWTPALDNTKTTEYTFVPNSTGQCTSSTPTKIIITVNEPKTPDFILAPICVGETPPILETTSPNGVQGTWNPAFVDNTKSGEYLFTPYAGLCAVPQKVPMTINKPTLTSVECIVSEAFSANNTIVVNATSEGNYQYQLDNDIPQSQNVFENVSPGKHTVTVFDVNSCSPPILKEISILDYPKFFTPNGDGFNETWNITALKGQTQSKIFIFDRFGKLLKQISPDYGGWDGKFNGHELPSTDYWFTVSYNEEDGRDKVFKSHFTLKR